MRKKDDKTLNLFGVSEPGGVDLSEGKRRADAGAQRAVDHADQVEPDWSERAWRLFQQYCREHYRFQAEDARHWCFAQGLGAPPDNRAWGGIIKRAARAGWIVPTGEYEKVSQSNCHASPMAVWRSTRCPQAVSSN